VFVGRERELEVLEAALGAVAAGRGGLHLPVGEPRIGETRLADEVAAHAEANGIAAFWGPLLLRPRAGARDVSALLPYSTFNPMTDSARACDAPAPTPPQCMRCLSRR
jgi:hypothetical protein